jgi:hypothetical protein
MKRERKWSSRGTDWVQKSGPGESRGAVTGTLMQLSPPLTTSDFMDQSSVAFFSLLWSPY